ncbi:hypothetical protein GSI_10652 [Ganoderma sinense ZZ0214-1]|uniref:Uncharacterized protein n=1 Tax=Ganoderma sinense ZZ0214-1 TaxID=1077348 RepID=A0A2G8S163_9APHY|nr:hypothetical protein GSI_10652 [Ganoderma sinense ZZ0214-1]
MNAREPSPYSVGMLISKIPKREYGWSSTLVVSRLEAQDIRRATLTSSSRFCCFNTSTSIPAISSKKAGRSCLEPMTFHSCDMNRRFRGAIGSWSVQPLVNHLLRRNLDFAPCGRSSCGTSTTKA